jgi:hypothetical protein
MAHHVVAQFDQGAAGFVHGQRPGHQRTGIAAAGLGLRDHLTEEIVVHAFKAMTQPGSGASAASPPAAQALKLATTQPAATDRRRDHDKAMDRCAQADDLRDGVIDEVARGRTPWVFFNARM